VIVRERRDQPFVAEIYKAERRGPNYRNVPWGAGVGGIHSLKERLARWLLMMRERSEADVMPITPNLLAELLGVQRPSLTHAVAELVRFMGTDRL
jgi:CRP-like cAMP-binding protein